MVVHVADGSDKKLDLLPHCVAKQIHFMFYIAFLPCSRDRDLHSNTGLYLRVPNRTFLLFLDQNICCGYSKELSQ